MINPKEFLLTDIPNYHPSSRSYLEFWREQKKRSIEGYWVSGKWMPGKLYFYSNFGTIRLNKPGSKVKHYGRPWLRDLEWEFFYHWTEARGFSGFELDENFTCLDLVRQWEQDELTFTEDYVRKHYPDALKADGSFKKYVKPREYLRKIHHKNLGSPLFENQAQNMFMLGARGYGKSYSVGVGVVLHEWLFDGKTKYDPNSDVTTAEIAVGAGDSTYSKETLEKTKMALERLPGSQEIGGTYYPAPFFKQYRGSWAPGKDIIAEYKKKAGSNWEIAGSKSSIKHRTFRDNPFAINGTRLGVAIFEEVGMFDNLKESYNASVETQRDGAFKFGSMMFLGTGGDMNGGGTLDAMEMFYNPGQFECIEFEDIWEFRSGKIGYFVPAYLGLNQFKNEDGFTDAEAAKKELEKARNKLRRAGSSISALEGEIVNRPVVPSEMFLQKQGNVFPIVELRRRLSELEDTWSYLEKRVQLYFDPESKLGGVNYKIDTKNSLVAIDKFPWKEHHREGAVVIYEFPQTLDEKVPEGAYIIGYDPYASDDPDGESLASIIVMKTKKYFNHLGHDEVVAIYVGRPYEGRHIVNETLYKLSRFYGNAKIYFENVRGNTKEYFEKIKRLDLLAKQPRTVLTKTASGAISTNRAVYGYPMSSRAMKNEAMQYVRDWLLEEREQHDGRVVRNLDRLWDRALVQELIAFNMDGNFDRVMSLAGCVIGLQETHNQYESHMEQSIITNQLSEFLGKNKFVFSNV